MLSSLLSKLCWFCFIGISALGGLSMVSQFLEKEIGFTISGTGSTWHSQA